MELLGNQRDLEQLPANKPHLDRPFAIEESGRRPQVGELDDRTLHLAPADSIRIPARTPHRVLWTPTVWLAVFHEPLVGGIH